MRTITLDSKQIESMFDKALGKKVNDEKETIREIQLVFPQGIMKGIPMAVVYVIDPKDQLPAPLDVSPQTLQDFGALVSKLREEKKDG